MQFSDIILSRRELKTMKLLLQEKHVRVFDNVEVFLYLSKLGFAESTFSVQTSCNDFSDDSEYYTITDLGRRYMLWHHQQVRKEVWDWVRYGVTTVIAVIALITAICAIG